MAAASVRSRKSSATGHPKASKEKLRSLYPNVTEQLFPALSSVIYDTIHGREELHTSVPPLTRNGSLAADKGLPCPILVSHVSL